MTNALPRWNAWRTLLGLCMAGACASSWAEATPRFSTEERDYIERQRTITMCVDPDWAPFERLDEQGQHVGIAADLVQLVAQRSGLTIQPLRVKTWDESLAASKAGRCQIMSFLNQTPERERWLRFTAPIFLDPNVIITREEHPFIPDLAALTNHTVALPRGTMVEERIRKDFPLLSVVRTDDERQAIEMVSRREVDLTIRSLIVAAYTIKQEGLFNLKIAGQVPQYTNQLRIGVLKDEPLLLSVLDKAVRTITPQERELISNRHVAIHIQQGLDWRLLWQLMAGAVVLAAVAVFWHRQLRRLDRARAAFAEAQVEQALRAQREQSQLVALLSHEVRTSLAMIDSASRSLQLLVDPKDEVAQLRVNRIDTGVQRLLELTDQFLTRDRLEYGTLVARREPVDAQELYEHILEGLDGAERVQAHTEGDTRLMADPDLLKVALRNLLVNALRYSPVTSSVKVTIRGTKDEVVICVTDDGPGIPMDERDQIFDSYVRGSNSKGLSGSGLGLQLVKRVAELHAGTVSLESVEGKGSVFSISFPRGSVQI